MRKIIAVFLLLFMIIPFSIKAETCDTSSVVLDSIELGTINGTAEEASEASVSGKKINLDLKLYNMGDSVEYNIKVKNTSSDDFYFDEDSLGLNTDYLEYSFIYDDDSNIIAAGSEKIIKLRVLYKNEVPAELLTNKSFNDTNKMVVNLSNKSETVISKMLKNPETGDFIALYLLILVISTIVIFTLRRKKVTNKYLILMVGLVVVPITVYALCKCEIELESKVQIIASSVQYPAGKNKASVETGDTVKIGTEEFYVVKHDGDKLVLIAKYNLLVGLIIDFNNETVSFIPESEEGYGLQSANATIKNSVFTGGVMFSGINYWSDRSTSELLPEYAVNGANYSGNPYPYVYNGDLSTVAPEIRIVSPYWNSTIINNGYTVAYYVENYVNKLKELGAPDNISGRLISVEEIIELGCSAEDWSCSSVDYQNNPKKGNAPSWLYKGLYWTGSVYSSNKIFFIKGNEESGFFADWHYDDIDGSSGVRPVIVI